MDAGAGRCCEPWLSLSLCWSIHLLEVKVKWLLQFIAGTRSSLFSVFFTLFARTEGFPLKSSAKIFVPPLLLPAPLLPYHYTAPDTARKVLRRCRRPEEGQRRWTVIIQPVGSGDTSPLLFKSRWLFSLITTIPVKLLHLIYRETSNCVRQTHKIMYVSAKPWTCWTSPASLPFSRTLKMK